MYVRHDLPHLKNHTNNRLESFFGKLKQELHANLRAAGDAGHSFRAQTREWNEFRIRANHVGIRFDTKWGLYLNAVLGVCSRFVAQLLERELDFAMSAKATLLYQMYYVNNGNAIVVYYTFRAREEDVHYKVNLHHGTCQCRFMQNLMLPCRHVMFVRRTHIEDARNGGDDVPYGGMTIPMESID